MCIMLFSFAKVKRIIYIASDLMKTLSLFNNKSCAIFLPLTSFAIEKASSGELPPQAP